MYLFDKHVFLVEGRILTFDSTIAKSLSIKQMLIQLQLANTVQFYQLPSNTFAGLLIFNNYWQSMFIVTPTRFICFAFLLVKL